ncbi:MAG TPA: cupin domain-containing protein [Roseiflexaceae bacterium]|nr:cupin domain-containing protein [Roseiflexaceae bacterium]
MIHISRDTQPAKGWFFGPWNSDIPVPIGFANQGIAEPHYHAQMHEIYLVAQGTSTAIVDGRTITLHAGDALAVAPNEVHTFTDSSPDYLHFVLQVPFVAGDKVLVDTNA